MTTTDEDRARAEEWLLESAGKCLSWDKSVASLTKLLAQARAQGMEDALIELLSKLDGDALDIVLRAMGHNPAELLTSFNESVEKALAAIRSAANV